MQPFLTIDSRLNDLSDRVIRNMYQKVAWLRNTIFANFKHYNHLLRSKEMSTVSLILEVNNTQFFNKTIFYVMLG